MALMKDPITDLPLGDPEAVIFTSGESEPEKIQEALSKMIFSASGWRKIFGKDENSGTRQISGPDKLIVITAASVFTRCLIEETGERSPVICVGIDSRTTGPVIAHLMIQAVLAEGGAVRYPYITAAPEIMAYTRHCRAAGFIYITASHNPPGYNGLKFGLSDGSVISGSASAYLAERLRREIGDPAAPDRMAQLLERAAPFSVEAVFRDVPRCKADSLHAYREFNRRVITGFEKGDDQNALWDRFSGNISASGIGVVAEFNGSARGSAGDTQFLREGGFKVREENSRPGEFVHPIVPEGESLNLCRELLERENSYDPGFLFGYVPDADGDRGNLVYTDERTGTALPLDAQEVFALAVLAELTWNMTVRKGSGKGAGEIFVAVNGPTSLRVDRIARALGARVARAEVGEANVVNLAARLRMMGRAVPILGEGSNGGNITHPSKVRDPIHTIFSAAKLLTLPELYRIWNSVRGMQPESEPLTFSKIRASLPGFVTTSVFEKRALVSIKTENHGDLKKRYEEIFLREWENMKGELEKKWGITGYYEVNYEGSSEQRGFGPNYRSGSQRGGLKMVFTRQAEPSGFLWMRGSGTEPVFRVMADIESTDPADEEFLLEWHKEMVGQADRPAG